MAKTACWIISGCSLAFLTVITALVPVDHLAWFWWRVFVFALLALAIAGIVLQGCLQLREDKKNRAERDEANRKISELHQRFFANSPSITIEPQDHLTLDDPRLYVDFVDERKGYVHKKNAFLLLNRGGSEAHDVQIERIPLRGNSVEFPHIAGVIPAKGDDLFEPRLEGRWGFVSANFVKALVSEWDSRGDANLTKLSIPLKITYQNFSQDAMFETRCTMIFDPYKEKLKLDRGTLIEFKDFQFRKVLLQSAMQPAGGPGPGEISKPR